MTINENEFNIFVYWTTSTYKMYYAYQRKKNSMQSKFLGFL